MSFSRNLYDNECQNDAINQSVNPCIYKLNTPTLDCDMCLSDDVFQRERQTLQNFDNVVDIDSDLKGLPIKLSDCIDKQYNPNSKDNIKPKTVLIGECRRGFDSTTPTRLVNPPCDSRGTDNGFNRWQWLHNGNPQCRVTAPFNEISHERIIAKDMFRPIIPNVCDQTNIISKDLSLYESDYIKGNKCPNAEWSPVGAFIPNC